MTLFKTGIIRNINIEIARSLIRTVGHTELVSSQDIVWFLKQNGKRNQKTFYCSIRRENTYRTYTNTTNIPRNTYKFLLILNFLSLSFASISDVQHWSILEKKISQYFVNYRVASIPPFWYTIHPFHPPPRMLNIPFRILMSSLTAVYWW